MAILVAALAIAAFTLTASADDDPRFRRTTPRGTFGRDGPEFLVGVPGGRAWGIESELRLVSAYQGPLRAAIDVRDPAIREAFVRVAWYDRPTGRPRQFALTDALPLRAGESRVLEIQLDPPPGAVAYRLRVLARLHVPDAVSAPDGLSVRLDSPRGASYGYFESTLLP